MTTSLKTRLTNEPYSLFLLTAILLFMLSFLMWGQSLDLHIHDTYIIITTNYFVWTISLIFFLVWGLYKLTDKILWTKKLIWLHVLTTIFVLIFFALIEAWHDKIMPTIKTTDVVSLQKVFEDQKRKQIITLTISIIFIVGQLSFFVNLVGGLFKRRL